MATHESRLGALITAIGTDWKTIWANTGTKANLTTTNKASLVDAINEINAKPSGVGGASIADGDAGTSTTTTYSASKIKSLNDAQDTTIAAKAAINDSSATNATTTTYSANKINALNASQDSTIAGKTSVLDTDPGTSTTATYSASKIKSLNDAQDTSIASKVSLTGAETIAGVKTFSSAPAVPDASFSIAKTSGLQTALNAKPDISDASATTSTTTTYSANKINTAIAAAVASLVNGASTTLDTLNEIATALGNDANFATTITTALGNRLRFDAAQTLTAAQKAQGKANLDAYGALEMGNPDADLVALYVAAKA